jgi:hypothetical protein
MDKHNLYIYIYIFLISCFCSFFVGKVLIYRCQYLLSGADLDDGCLAEINMDSIGKIILYSASNTQMI